jgi:hypothetical protein
MLEGGGKRDPNQDQRILRIEQNIVRPAVTGTRSGRRVEDTCPVGVEMMFVCICNYTGVVIR